MDVKNFRQGHWGVSIASNGAVFMSCAKCALSAKYRRTTAEAALAGTTCEGVGDAEVVELMEGRATGLLPELLQPAAAARARAATAMATARARANTGKRVTKSDGPPPGRFTG